MGRPSLIELGLKIDGGRLTAATIGGSAVIVTEGTIAA
jgi:trans-2,3-dihydro-3-hydroxyanthranilate isomerase